MEEMSRQAENFDSKVVSILGNHEIMNLLGDFRYASYKDIKNQG